MSVKRVLRSAAKLNSTDGITRVADIRSQGRVRKKMEMNPGIDSPPDETDHPPSKKARLAAPANSTVPIVTEVVRNDDTNLATSNHNRIAQPHMTNAPLQTLDGSYLVATSSKDVTNLPPTHSIIPPPFSTAENLLKQACDHLISVDKRLKPLIERYPCPLFSPQGLAEKIDPFESLCSGIISQQISGAAATSVKKKFVGLFCTESRRKEPQRPEQFPSPVEVAASDISFLRRAGLSQRKAEYIKGLAEQFACGNLTSDMLVMASDEEVLEKLTAVRGLGKWSVEMFSCFGLKRLDVFSTGDLGVQYGPFSRVCKA
jgi:DNA-3-methyladenine glycosylase II